MAARAMRENPIRKAAAEKSAAFGIFLTLDSPLLGEALASFGFDLVVADTQHGEIDPQTVSRFLPGIEAAGALGGQRVPWREPGILMRALDIGCACVICPMVNTAAEAEELVRWTKYPPLGERSYGPFRASTAQPGYFQARDSWAVVFAMIETRAAVDNLDAILAVDGLDGVFVGPRDLSLSMGKPVKGDPDDPEVVAAIAHVAKAAEAAGVIPGIHVDDGAQAARMAALGYRYVSVGTETKHLGGAVKHELAAARG